MQISGSVDFIWHVLKGKQIRGILYGRERNRLKTPEQITSVIYLHVTLFKIHEKDTATDKELNTVLRVTVEHVL